MIRKETNEESINRCGGNGTLEVHKLMDKDDLNGKGMGVTRIVFPAGASIGEHVHNGSSEQYYVLRGSGIFYLNGEAFHISAGETGVMRPGDTHGIANTGDTEMEIIGIHTFE